MDALVTDVHLPSAVAGLRGLGRAGYRPVALGDEWSAAGLWSRYAARRAVGPTAATDPAGFTAAVGRLATVHGPLVVYPGWDGAIPAVLAGLPAPAILPYPDTAPEVLHRLRDKRELPGLPHVGAIKVPSTLAQGPAKEIVSTSVRFPCVVKPARSDGFLLARPAGSAAALQNLLADIEPNTELLVQEQIRGELVMLALVLDRDRTPVAYFQQVARRLMPPDGGAASAAVSVPADARLVRAASEMLAEAGFSGMAQLDFIRCDGSYFLIDINPRYYSSMPLAIACGVNLAAIWHAVVVDEAIPPCHHRTYRTGVGFRWLEADIRTAINGRPRVLAERTQGPRVGAMWAWDDPVPGPLLFVRATRGRWPRLARSKGSAGRSGPPIKGRRSESPATPSSAGRWPT
jgi:predicted ATP-grasp superfamily ATP-dependent carboligase